MSFIEIEIECYQKKEAEIVGEDKVENTPTKCMINLDKIDSFWVDPDNKKILIYMDSGVSYWTESFSYEEMCSIVRVFNPCVLASTEDAAKSASKGKTKLPLAVRCDDCGCLSAFNICNVCGRILE